MNNRVMEFFAPGEPTKMKKVIYLISSVVMGVLLGMIVYALVELGQLKSSSSYALMPMVRIMCIFGGAVGGFFIGRVWWRKIYVERVWARRK